MLADGGRHQIDFELDAQDPAVGRHKGEGGVSASRVNDGGHNPGVEEAVLLRDVVAVGQVDMYFAGADGAERRADGLHCALLHEALADAGLVVWVGRGEEFCHAVVLCHCERSDAIS